MRSIRRSLVIAALLYLGVIGYRLVAGHIDLVDAAQRAGAVLVALVALQWVLKVTLTRYLTTLEMRARREAAEAVVAEMQQAHLRRIADPADQAGAGAAADDA